MTKLKLGLNFFPLGAISRHKQHCVLGIDIAFLLCTTLCLKPCKLKVDFRLFTSVFCCNSQFTVFLRVSELAVLLFLVFPLKDDSNFDYFPPARCALSKSQWRRCFMCVCEYGWACVFLPLRFKFGFL